MKDLSCLQVVTEYREIFRDNGGETRAALNPKRAHELGVLALSSDPSGREDGTDFYF